MLFQIARQTHSRSLGRSRSVWSIDIATYKSSPRRDAGYGQEVSDNRVVVPSPSPAIAATPSLDVPHEERQTQTQTQTLKNQQDCTTSSSSSSSLANLPLTAVIRSLAITTCTSVPALLGPALGSLSMLANSKSAMLNPDKNGLLNAVLRRTIYSQFCAGETPAEVRRTIADLKTFGYAGVILGYGREVVMDGAETSTLLAEAQAGKTGGREGATMKHEKDGDKTDVEQNQREIHEWKEGTMQTVDLAQEGDFVALKFTGAGRQALRHLVHGLPPSPDLQKAIHEICDRARDRKILLLFDAEQHAVQPTIDAWVFDLQRKYNGAFFMRGRPRALVYNTYQAYLQSTPGTLAEHLAISQRESFVLGVKLVRGAYLNSDPRHLFWPTKADTDNSYDSIARCLITRQYNDFVNLSSSSCSSSGTDVSTPPQVDLVLASHNRASVEKARALRDEQVRRGEPLIEMVYGQLQGMADDISCKLVHESKNMPRHHHHHHHHQADREIPKPYKYLVWGTVGECTKYLLRRGHENRDAASRTKDTRTAMFQELKRRSFQTL